MTNKVQFLGKKTTLGFNYLYCVTANPIDGNNIAPSNEDAKKRKANDLNELFQIFDADGIKYFSGYYNSEKICPLNILSRFMHSHGAVEVRVRNSSGKMEMV